jgi:hypothetical protein
MNDTDKQPPGEGWQPIASGPKTGPVVDVDLFLPDGGRVVQGHWAYGDGEGLMPPYGPAWFHRTGGDHPAYVECRPTHWRPCSDD